MVKKALPRGLESGARWVGGDVCWPLGRARSVIDSLAASGLAVLGLEIWRFEPGEALPKVIGASTYAIDRRFGWPAVVATNRLAALRDLDASPLDSGLWVQVEWIEESELS